MNLLPCLSCSTFLIFFVFQLFSFTREHAPLSMHGAVARKRLRRVDSSSDEEKEEEVAGRAVAVAGVTRAGQESVGAGRKESRQGAEPLSRSSGNDGAVVVVDSVR